MNIRIEGGRVLVADRLEETSIHMDSDAGIIAGVGEDAAAERTIDASGFIVLPGIVDIHGDAFERQMMPRPRVAFPLDIALLDSDRQAIANGITTVFHGVTWSWEPGLRGPENARAILEGIERLRGKLGADTRYHLRHETYNLDAEPEISEWLADRRIDVIAFNDHMSSIVGTMRHDHKFAPMVERSGLTRDEFLAGVARTNGRRGGRLDRAARRGRQRQRRSAAFPRRHQPGAAALVPLARLQSGGIPDHRGDRRGRRGAGRRHRDGRPQRGARRQPYRLDQRH